MDKVITIGITGGIGSGKTYVCRIIEAMGYPVFYSDNIAKNILNTDADVIHKITNCFGTSAYLDGNLNKEFIASEIFKDESLRVAINNIVHPAVRTNFQSWCKNQKSKLVFNEAAILFETGAYNNFDYTILITASKQIKIDRLKKRDGLTEKDIQRRLDSQWKDEEKIPLANFVINNDETELLLPKVVDVIKIIQNE